MSEKDHNQLKGLIGTCQTKFIPVACFLIMVFTTALTTAVYSYLLEAQTSINQLTEDTANITTALTIGGLQNTISKAITTLLIVVGFGSIIGGLIVWKLAKHIQLSQLLIRYLSDGICITDKRLRIQSVNQEFCRLTGIAESDLHGNKLYECFPTIFPVKPKLPIANFRKESVGRDINGASFNIEMSFSFLTHKYPRIELGLLTVRDITKLRKTEANLRSLAYTDDLTHLPNRAHFMAQIKELIYDHSITGERFALFFLDLDGFKDINDSLGHQAGDQLLRQMAERLSVDHRDYDFVARLGGDEFCVLLKDVPDLAMAEAFAQRLLDKVAEPLTINGRSIVPQTSIGYALYPDHANNRESLLQAADLAMYKAKNDGKHRASPFDPNITHSVRDRLNLEHDLRNALRDEQFVLFYQPQVSLQTGEMTGVEALIRWKHPTKGLIFPDEFIDSIERIGMMETLGEWVILQACKQQKTWHEDGIDLNVAVNISGTHFQSGKLVSYTMRALATADIPAERLEIEITENVMQVADTTIENFIALRDLGVKVAIDDFGTGYSSLASLRTLPVDHLKVDRMFLHEVLTNEKQAVIISTIVGMAQALGLKVIVEGVESMEHVLLLQSLGCDLVQGYYFSKPVAATDISSLYRAGFRPENPASLTQLSQRG